MSAYREPPQETTPKWFRYNGVCILTSTVKYAVRDGSDDKYPYRVKFLDGEILRLSDNVGKALLEVIND